MNECMNSNQWLPPKGMGSIKKKKFPKKGMDSTQKNDYISKEWLPLKIMAFTKRSGFY